MVSWRTEFECYFGLCLCRRCLFRRFEGTQTRFHTFTHVCMAWQALGSRRENTALSTARSSFFDSAPPFFGSASSFFHGCRKKRGRCRKMLSSPLHALELCLPRPHGCVNVTQTQFATQFFIGLWMVQFLIYHTYLVISGSYSDWYFSEYVEESSGKETSKKEGIGNKTIFQSFIRATRYHIGSVAYGALLMAIIKFMKWVVRYIKYQSSLKPDGNAFIEGIKGCIFSVVEYFLQLLEGIVNRMNKGGLIIVGINGSPLCSGECVLFCVRRRKLLRTFFWPVSELHCR